MSNIYEVNNKHIENLNDLQLTKILSKLMYIEADRNNIDKSTVNCSLKITVADGGEDGSIKWENGPDSTDWFKCRYNLFQCKATEMGPQKCKEEILERDKNGNVKIKKMVEKVFEENGCYILFYNKSLNEKNISARIRKFREALEEAQKSYYETASIYVYDANKIAAWVNNYLSAIVEVLFYNGMILPDNLLAWDEWSKYRENTLYKFEVDETIESNIAQLRNHFKGGEKKVARIIGLSGLGKTRIALETFRDNNTLESSFINNEVVYIDADHHENQILVTVAELRRNEISGIIVVDNCNLELHKKLVREIEHSTSKLNLLTLDYNLERMSAANYPVIELKPVSSTVIKKIIKQSYTNIPEDDINRIAEFAQGFPQMAVLISEARLNGEDTLGTLNDSEIANKLLWGRDNEDKFKLEVIKACSIFENFGFYEDKSIERDYIADSICDGTINRDDFYKYARYFIDKGILDKRGRYLAVTPLPLAIRLAAQWWRECSPDKGRRIILSDMPNNMVDFLCNQIGKLHFVEEARSLTSDLCSSTGPFGQAEVLTTKKGGRVFRALSKVNPQATSLAIYRAFKNYSIKELKQITNERRELIWALENLCFWKETFDNSARALLMLAASENENWSNNATGILKQLFHAFLSGTQAEPNQRLNIIKEALNKSEEEYKILGIKLLGSAIETHGYSKSLGPEKQGSRPVSEEWKPKLWQEVFDYWEESLLILTNIAKEKSKLGEMSRREIVSNFRGLVQYGRIDALDNSLNIIGKELNYNWIELIDSIKTTIRFDSSKMPKIGIKKLDEWLNLFMPNMLQNKLKLIVSLPTWDGEENEEGKYIDTSEIRCKEFAKECLGNMDEVYNNLFVLYNGEQRQGYNFGRELGLHYNNPRKFIQESIKCLIDNDNPNLVVLAGFLTSLRTQNDELLESTLDLISKEKKLNKYLVYLVSSIKPINNDIDRILNLLNDKKFEISTFRYLSYGNSIENISVEYLRKLCISLKDFSIEGKLITLNIVNRSKQKLNELRDILIDIIFNIDVINNLDKFSQMDKYYWEQNLKLLLKEHDGEHYAIQLYELVMKNLLHYKYDWRLDKQYETVLKILLENYPKKIWELLVNNLMEVAEKETWRIEQLLCASWLYINEDNTLIELIDKTDIINDINKYGMKLALIVSAIIKRYDYRNDDPRFDPIIRYIIENYGENNEQLLNNIFFNMGPKSWSGSIIPIYEEKIKVLSEYISCNKINVRNWAKENIDRINRAIEVEKIREEEYDKGIY